MISVFIVVTLVTTVQAAWWDKFDRPVYGGTFTQGSPMMDANFDGHDPRELGAWYDPLFWEDWAIEPVLGKFVEAGEYRGMLAESWEQTDPTMITIHLKKNIRWQNKPPTNGREFVADDVVYNFDRILGTGHGFDQPNPFFGGSLSDIERVQAVDKYTVAIKLKRFTAFTIYQLLAGPGWGSTLMVAPEWVALGGSSSPAAPPGPPKGDAPKGDAPKGDAPKGGGKKGGPPIFGAGGPAQDWRNAVGTGPWILTDFVSNVSATCSRNPDYWGKDERHPENSIPYYDTLRVIAIPNLDTQLSALRTRKIDIISDPRDYPAWQQVASILKTNPDMQHVWLPVDGYSLDMRCDNKPFTDINVRKALQLAIDRKTIASNVLNNTVSGIPCGFINPINTDWTVPYDKWPSQLQQEYSYNPTRAKELLAQAGYPDGFTVDCDASSQDNMEMLEILKSQLADIGVKIDINLMDNPTFMSYCMAGKNQGMAFFVSTGLVYSPLNDLMFGTSLETKNYTHNNDAKFEEYYEKISATTNVEEAKKLCREADLYALTQHWSVRLFGNSASALWQPYVQGYSGKVISARQIARMWTNPGMK